MAKKMLLVFNLKAGTSSVRGKVADILNILTRGGYDVTAHPSQGPDDMERYVRGRGHEFDVVVVCGGDGSLNNTINGLMTLDDPPPLGYIPTGTMNDFAASHQINSNMLLAAKDVVNGMETYTDIGCFNGRYFSYVAAFGAFTDVAYGTPQASKNIFGKGAYLVEGIRRLPMISAQHLKVKCDNLEAEGDYIYGMASNALSVGGFNLDRKTSVSMDDGCFELILVKKGVTAIFNAPVMLAALTQNIENNRYLEYARTSKVVLTSEEPISWTLDGEFGGDIQEATIECIRQKLKIIVPQSEYGPGMQWGQRKRSVQPQFNPQRNLLGIHGNPKKTADSVERHFHYEDSGMQWDQRRRTVPHHFNPHRSFFGLPWNKREYGDSSGTHPQKKDFGLHLFGRKRINK